MELIGVDEVVEATSGELVAGDEKAKLRSIGTDSRTLKKGDFFIALEGRRYSGHDFLEEAEKKGCSGVMFSKELPGSIKSRLAGRDAIAIRVRDTLVGLQDIARFYRRRFRIPVVGVTGSNGKTITKEMISAAASGPHTVLCNEGTENNQIGVPLTLLKLDRRHSLAVLEMGMNARGEIRRLAEIAEPTIGVVLNVGHAHIGFLGSLEDIAAAKSELLEVISSSRQNGRTGAVLNCDDPYLVRMKDRFDLDVRTFGMSREADVCGEDLRQEDDGLAFTIDFRRSGCRLAARIPVVGVHNVYNALAAAVTCEMLEIAPQRIVEGLSSVKIPHMRMEITKKNGVMIINDAYNANPESMRAALLALAEVDVKGRRIFVVGDMLELGEAAASAHEALGRLVAESGVDILISVGELGSVVAKSALDAGISEDAVMVCGDIEKAAAVLSENVKDGDCILLKASRRIGIERVLLGLEGVS